MAGPLDAGRRIAALIGKADNAPGVIRAYHGSPHSFSRFDASKIGTGEGAQAYGHGLYFAGNEGVAKNYRNNLSGQLLVDGEPLPVGTDTWARDWAHRMASVGDVSREVKSLRHSLHMASLDHAELRKIADDLGPEAAYEKVGLMSSLASAKYRMENLQDRLRAYESLAGKKLEYNRGHMYEVEIDAPEDSLLDLDLPVQGQPQFIQDALGKYVEAPSWFSLGQEGWVGKNAYMRMAGDMADANPRIVGGYHVTHDQPAASAALLQAGVPGIRYLDGGSRHAGPGGTRNYVMFPGTEDRIRILRQYGLLPPLAGGLALQEEE